VKLSLCLISEALSNGAVQDNGITDALLLISALDEGDQLHTPPGQVKVKVTLRPTVSRPVRLDVRHPSGTRDQLFFLFEIVLVIM
jgi:hypothetical protein